MEAIRSFAPETKNINTSIAYAWIKVRK